MRDVTFAPPKPTSTLIDAATLYDLDEPTGCAAHEKELKNYVGHAKFKKVRLSDNIGHNRGALLGDTSSPYVPEVVKYGNRYILIFVKK